MINNENTQSHSHGIPSYDHNQPRRTQHEHIHDNDIDQVAKNYCEEDINMTEDMYNHIKLMEQETFNKNHKFLEVILRDQNGEQTSVSPKEFSNILINDHEIMVDEFNKALDIVVSYLMQKNAFRIISDLNKRNIIAGPVKKMTMDDIEEELGHRFEIINK